jgi:hypothetical protein
MNLQVGGNTFIDQAEELQPLLMSMPLLARANDRSVKCVQCGKERCRSMAHVVVRHRCRATTLEWQTQLRAIQRLNLALPFVNRHPKASFAAALNVLKIPFRVFSSRGKQLSVPLG